MATHCRQENCGFSLYRGVLVVWDEDHDTRVLTFIDSLAEENRKQLLVVQEHEGSIAFIWDRYCPKSCEGAIAIYDDEGFDEWSVEGSLVLRPIAD
jgi:hypothetical protein